MDDHYAGPTSPRSVPGAFAGGADHKKVDYNRRMVESVPQPAKHAPSDAEFFLSNGMPNHHYLKGFFFQEGRLTEQQALYILQKATEMLSREPNLLEISSPLTICGDIHGQYYDLMKIFKREVGGSVEENTYLFLGDYVDRGAFSIECLLYLYSLKLSHPRSVFMLRGNHECQHLTEYFTFKKECTHKYSQRVYEACTASFRALPVAAVVDNRFFAVHGGISPSLITLDDLRKLNRFQEPGSHGLLCDLLWSDPVQEYGNEEQARIKPGTTFLDNASRGCSYFFTYEAVCQFLERNGLLGVIRGHEAQDHGYSMYKRTPAKKFPSVITIFSAPNYLDIYKNRGAVLKYANKSITIRQFNSSSHPYWLPNFMNAFTWSLPFVGAKITEMLLAIVSICSEEELQESERSSEDGSAATGDSAEIRDRREEIRNKIRAVGKMQRVFQLLRDEAEQATTELESLEGGGVIGEPNNRLTIKALNVGRDIGSFADAKRSDKLNERLPTYNPNESSAVFPVPSMRRASWDTIHPADPTPKPGSSNSAHGGANIEELIRGVMEEDDEQGVVERLAEQIARGRAPTGRHRPLKRFDTAL